MPIIPGIYNPPPPAAAAGTWNVKDFGATGDGFTDDTSAIQTCIDQAPAGSVIYFPNGLYRFAPLTITKCVHLFGDGRYSSWLRPASAATGGLIRFELPGVVNPRNHYGATATGLGWDLTPFPTSVGLYVNANTGWFHARDFYMQGGAVHVENHAANNKYELFRLLDAGVFFRVNGDTGLELTLKDGDMTRFSEGTTSWAIEVIGTITTANGGDLRVDNVVANGFVSPGVNFNGGILLQFPQSISIPVFANDVVIDNCAGPGLRLVNIRDVHFNEGWINSAAGTTACVEIEGGGRNQFAANSFFGGDCTYEFLGATATAGFISRDNVCPTGPLYKITGATPTDMIVDDYAPGATATSQITNNEAALRSATARRWGKHKFQDTFEFNGKINAGDTTIKTATLPGGTPNRVTISVTGGLDAFYSQFIPLRLSVGGTTGRLEVINKDAVAGTVTIESTDAADTSTVGYFRVDIPH